MPACLKLKESNCKNCYKCIRHCPVKSIRFSRNQANIIDDACVLCGSCFMVCPQNAKEIRSDIHIAEALIKSGAKVVASVAPSFVAGFEGIGIDAMRAALAKLGFADAEETAIGATIVKRQYDRMVCEEQQDVIISSCCPSVNMLIQKYYPEALPYLAAVVSPMEAHCRDIKRRYPEAKTVFIGPCISKKAEITDGCSAVDCVLTFEELSLWLEREGVRLSPIPDSGNGEKGLARFFPTDGGILLSMVKENPSYTYVSISGMGNCIRSIMDAISGKLGKCFIEMSACVGSCVGGPAMNTRRRFSARDSAAVAGYAGKQDFEVANPPKGDLVKMFDSRALKRVNISGRAIEEILRETGKTRPEHELNCGTCGYDTCRDKAKAVIEGKADINMCLPYLMDKAESFSDTIVSNSPNAILVLDKDLEIQQINASACRLMNIKEQDILGDHVVKILDPTPFMEICERGENMMNTSVYLADYQKHVEQTIIYDKSYHLLICIMRDITDETHKKADKEQFNRKAIELTNRVIEKQMTAVQEIASLLGETTAETKVALTKLKESLSDD